MFILSNFLIALAKVLEVLLSMLYWVILIRALVSWVNPDPFNPIVQFLTNVTEPILDPIRRRMPLRFRMGIDISPVIAFLGIMLAKEFLSRTLIELAMMLRR